MTLRTLQPSPACFRLPAGLGALLGLLLAPSAFAQPMTVSASLVVGEEPSGHLKSAELVVRRWTSATRFEFELPVGGDDGKSALLHGTVDTSHPDTWAVGRVCKDVPLSMAEKGTEGFAVTILADTEAQVVSQSKGGVVVKVPGPGPNVMEDERLMPVSALAASCPQRPAAPQAARTNTSCETFTLYSRPDETSSSFEVTAVYRISTKADKNGWQQVTFDDFNGFRWRGWARVAPKCEEQKVEGTISSKLSSHGSPAAPVPCRQAILPRGATLRAADRKTVLLTVKRDFQTKVCNTEKPFEWEVDLEAGSGEATVRGYFDGSPRPTP